MSLSLAGVGLGLIAGSGLLLALDAFTRRPSATSRMARRRRGPTSAAVAAGVGSAVVAGVLGLLVTGLPVVGVLSALTGSALPAADRRRREARDRRLRLAAWPDAIDDLRSEVRAGVGLPDAVASLTRTGPIPLRPAFLAYSAEYRATASFAAGLAALRQAAADPVADRVVAALGLAHEAGGAELGTVLAALSGFLREDRRTRAEIEARQSWTVTAARLAVAAPWLTLVVMCTRPGTVAAFRTASGVVVLASVAATSAAAYLLMMRLGRLPMDARSHG